MIITRPALSGSIGPAGGVPTANLVLWLKADAQVYNDAGSTLATNGQTVQQWNDQSGHGYNVSQATSGNRPKFVTGAINGLPAVQFDATRPDGMEVANNSDFNLDQAFSMFIIVKVTSFPALDYNYWVSKDNNGSAGAAGYFVSHNAAGRHATVERPNTSLAGSATSSMNTTDFFHLSVIQQAGTPGTTNYFSINTADGNSSMNNGTTTAKPLRIGWHQDTHLYPLTGFIAELLIYKTNLGSTDRTTVNAYLTNKYAL